MRFDTIKIVQKIILKEPSVLIFIEGQAVVTKKSVEDVPVKGTQTTKELLGEKGLKLINT